MFTFYLNRFVFIRYHLYEKIRKFDQEIPQSQTADEPTAPRGRATEHFTVTRHL